MKSYIQPTIDNAPDRICLHIGTNDLKSKAPDDIANATVDLGKTIQSTCGAEVVLSELTMRKDAHKESVKCVNKLLIKYSKQHQWSLVRHSNITEKVLNRGGLHLTKQGNELLYKNFAACLAAKEANHHWTVSSNADRLECYESHINSYNNCISTQSILDQQRSIINNHIPSKRGFKLASLNVNKLSTHIDEIRILLADKCLDVLAIQETKLDVFHNNSDFYICGYELIWRDRLSDGGGGICFYIKPTINFSVWTDLNVDELENLCIEIRKPNSKPFIVVYWYRPPNSPIGLFSHLKKSYYETWSNKSWIFPTWWYECRYGLNQLRQQCPSTNKHCWYLWPPPTHFWAYLDNRQIIYSDWFYVYKLSWEGSLLWSCLYQY